MENDRSVNIEGNSENANVITGDNVQKIINNYGIPKQDYDKCVKGLGGTDCAMENFFQILDRNQVSGCDLGIK